MNGGKSKIIGNLCKIHMSGSDQIFCSVDLQLRKIVDDAKSTLIFEYLLQSRSADQVVLADLFNSEMRTNMFFHVFSDQTVDFNVIFGFC